MAAPDALTARTAHLTTTVALLVGALTGALTGVLAGAGPAQAAAFDPATLCPGPAPSAADLAAVLDGLAASGVTRSGGTGIKVDVYESDREDPEQDVHQAFRGDPSTGRAVRSWYDSGNDGTIDGWSERYVEVRAHHSYRHFDAELGGIPLDAAVISVLRRNDPFATLWVRTGTTQPTTWPYRDHLDITDTARRALAGATGYSFTCTVTDATMHVVGTGPAGERTFDLTVDDAGAPVDVRLDDTAQPTTSHATAQYVRPSLKRPRAADVVDPKTYRRAAVRGMVEELRRDVLLRARPEVKQAGTLSKRLKVLQRISAQENGGLLRLYNQDAPSKVTSTAKKLSTGKRYKVRYGDATGYLRFSIKGRTIETNTAFR